MSIERDDPRHGTVNAYKNLDCRCQPCRSAWRVYNRPYSEEWRARNISRGLTEMGKPRTTPYKSTSLALMAKYGLEPNPDWLLPPDTCRRGHVGQYSDQDRPVCRRCQADDRMRRYYERKETA